MQALGPPTSQHVSVAVRESFSRLIHAVIHVLPAVVSAVVVLLVFWGLATLARKAARAASRFIQDQTIRLLVVQVTYYLVWIVGIFVTLDAIGMNLQTVTTGLGLGGVAVGFALKDILSNLVSGVLILAMRPFEIGDQIVVGETEGTVEQIELRATHIRTYDGRLVLVPNGEVFTSRITNNTASPLRRGSVSVYLDYKEDTGRALAVILDTLRSVPGVAAFPAPSIGLSDLKIDGVQLEARFWAESHRANLISTASAARVAIVLAMSAAGIRFPDKDQRIVTIAAAEPDAPGATDLTRRPAATSGTGQGTVTAV
jgi:small conductance mechanosensitive channel